MNLLEEYKQAQEVYWMVEAGLRKQLEPYKEKASKLRDELEIAILKNKIYMPYADLIKLEGRISRVDMIIQYSEGYQKIEKYLFNSFNLRDGKLEDTSIYPPRFKWVRDNIYTDWSLGEKSDHTEIKVLGCYDLEINGEIIKEATLKYLWDKRNK